MPRPVSASVSVSALAHNLSVVRRRAPGSRVWAVVKAHAYGHGLPAAVLGLGSADGMALVEFDNARRLRALGWRGPILMLEGAFDAHDVATAGELGLSLAVHDATQVEWLREHRGGTVDVWLKLNTGMNRLGIAPEQAAALQRTLASLPCVGKVSLMTHFADADRPGGAEAAIERFERATAALPGSRSMANSAAVFDVPGLSVRDRCLTGVGGRSSFFTASSAHTWQCSPPQACGRSSNVSHSVPLIVLSFRGSPPQQTGHRTGSSHGRSARSPPAPGLLGPTAPPATVPVP